MPCDCLPGSWWTCEQQGSHQMTEEKGYYFPYPSLTSQTCYFRAEQRAEETEPDSLAGLAFQMQDTRWLEWREAVTGWNVCCLEWEIALWEKSPLCKKVQRKRVGGGGELCRSAAEFTAITRFLVLLQTKAYGAGKRRTRCCSYCGIQKKH